MKTKKEDNIWYYIAIGFAAIAAGFLANSLIQRKDKKEKKKKNSSDYYWRKE